MDIVLYTHLSRDGPVGVLGAPYCTTVVYTVRSTQVGVYACGRYGYDMYVGIILHIYPCCVCVGMCRTDRERHGSARAQAQARESTCTSMGFGDGWIDGWMDRMDGRSDQNPCNYVHTVQGRVEWGRASR